ncbi:MAG: protein-tyrosine-phosphatase [Bacteroidota bacterium]
MADRPNLLVICGKNKRRSRTAEFVFKNDERFNIRSAGLSPKSDRKLSEKDLLWADLVLVMETDHRSKIREIYRPVELPVIEVLFIDDVYEYMDEELIEILNAKINDIISVKFDL